MTPRLTGPHCRSSSTVSQSRRTSRQSAAGRGDGSRYDPDAAGADLDGAGGPRRRPEHHGKGPTTRNATTSAEARRIRRAESNQAALQQHRNAEAGLVEAERRWALFLACGFRSLSAARSRVPRRAARTYHDGARRRGVRESDPAATWPGSMKVCMTATRPGLKLAGPMGRGRRWRI